MSSVCEYHSFGIYLGTVHYQGVDIHAWREGVALDVHAGLSALLYVAAEFLRAAEVIYAYIRRGCAGILREI